MQKKQQVSYCRAVKMKYCRTKVDLQTAMSVVLNAKSVAVDLEGHDLGREGKISLVQLCCEKGLYIIDVMEVPLDALISYMRKLFSSDAQKLMYDCRSDCDAMYHLWGVKFNRIIDVQLLEVMSRKKKGDPSNTRIKSLKQCMKEFAVGNTTNQDVVSKRMREGGSAFWMERPLDGQLLEYAAEDVSLLQELFEKIRGARAGSWPSIGEALGASSRYADLKVAVDDTEVLSSKFYNNALLPLMITGTSRNCMQLCKGCKRKVKAQKKGSYCVVCQNFEFQEGSPGYPKTTRQQLMGIAFSKDREGKRPIFAKRDYKIELPTLKSVIPHNLLQNLAASAEESRRKKGWYGAGYLKDLYVAERLGSKGKGRLTREAALLKEATARRLFRDLLIVETTQNMSDVRAYDLRNTKIPRGEGSNNKFHLIYCSGLAEKRPSVLIGDKVRVQDNATLNWHLGFVYYVNLDHLVVSFGSSFPEKTTFHVIFDMPVTNWRKQFLALDKTPLLTGKYIDNNFADCHNRTPSGASHWHTGSTLNSEQKECVNRILHPAPPMKHHLVLLHGPPGTGKTTTLVTAINLLLKQGTFDHTRSNRPRILVATPSNEAANLLFERLVKCGGASSSPKHIRLLAESYDISNCPEKVQRFAKRASSLNVTDLVGAELIVCTLMVTGTLYSMGLEKGTFTHIAIDEAGQATETEILVPLQFMKGPSFSLGERGTSVSLAGDHKQLGPVLRSMPSKILGFGVSTLERLLNTCPQHSVQLLDSYRAHPSIMAVYNELTYNNTLRACAPFAKRELLKGTSLFPNSSFTPSPQFHPLAFYHVEGKEAREEDSPSWKNEAEAFKVVDLVEELLRTMKLGFEDIVVLTPYLKQCKVIRDKIHFKFEGGSPPFSKPLNYKRSQLPIRVCSVESFQGREADVVILSCVRSQEAEEVPNDHKQSIGFLQQPQRLNVAISRPISGLFVVGNVGTLMSDPHWEKLIEIFHHRFSAILHSSSKSELTDTAFEHIKARYASQTSRMKNHAKNWAHTVHTKDEYEAFSPVDTEWNRPE